jgi:hypothetical protein
MPETDPDLAQMLGAAFDAFEAIRHCARDYEDRAPDLFAAFIAAATAAANGRDAVLTASVFPADAEPPPGSTQPALDASPDQAADSIAASAAILADWLNQAADLAATSHDQDACHDAAAAARQIHQLMADDTRIR